MAIFSLNVQVIGRNSGRSAVAAAAYRAGENILEDRTGDRFDYSKKSGIAHTQIMAPEGSPDWVKDRSELWNSVEHREKRKDSRLCREFQIAIPKELNKKEQIKLVQEYVKSEFIDKGMVADIAIHDPHKEGKDRNPHAHIMVSTREMKTDGWSKDTNRSFNKKEKVNEWREGWTEKANSALERSGSKERIDHRSLKDQHAEALAQGNTEKAIDLDREPTVKMGYSASAQEAKGIATDRGDINRKIKASNIERAKKLWGEFKGKAKEVVKDAGQQLRDLIARGRESNKIEAERPELANKTAVNQLANLLKKKPKQQELSEKGRKPKSKDLGWER